jgi:SAM-dependent methyltransferase
MTETTHDIFLKGALTIEQPSKGYRAGTDAVLLAAAAASFPVGTALEAGCGVGTALLSLGSLRADSMLRLNGLEKDEAAWSLAKANAARNPLQCEVSFLLGDVLAPGEALLGQFDLVFSNSVIEHVGNLDMQLLFAKEMMRCGKFETFEDSCSHCLLYFVLPKCAIIPPSINPSCGSSDLEFRRGNT